MEIKRTGKKYSRKNRKGKFKEKLKMYDMIIANLIAGKSIIEPTEKLDNSQIAIGFSNIASETQLNKYFLVRQFPDYLQPQIMDVIRRRCVDNGVKINFYIYANPYKIDWNSAEMRNKMDIWRKYSSDVTGDVSVWDYREKRGSLQARERIIMSTKYLNEAELDHKRSLLRIGLLIEISAYRDDDSIINMMNSIKLLKDLCVQHELKIRELRVNMIDWLTRLDIFSLKSVREIDSKIPRKILTDDILANFNSFKQGRVGKDGVPLGIDILSGVPVFKKFKADPDDAENWLIVAETKGGKSFFIKTLLTYLIADGFVVTVMDYEGDEYNNLASYIRAGNPDDVRIISMGKSSMQYVDPTPIPDITGDDDIDDELKDSAINYIIAHFRIMVGGLEGNLSKWEESVISMAIRRVYDSAGVTEDKNTWIRSKGLVLKDIYDEVKIIVESKELVDFDTDNVKHKAALNILEASSIYFEEGESKANTFKNNITMDELYKAKMIIFSFGMRGAIDSITDRLMLALKQLSVACISSQISNYCKYVKKCFNVKVWEEFQRWGNARGSSEIVINAMTGGRKRGDVNFIITNDLSRILDEDDYVASGIRQNIQNMAIGRIKDRIVRRKFCDTYGLNDIEVALDRIAVASDVEDRDSHDSSSDRYRHAFCVILDNGKKAITKVILPPSLTRSKLFRTGVDIERSE